MTIARVNPGGWVQNDPLTQTQINTLDTNVTLCIDGTGGGTYNNTAEINLSGAGGFKLSGSGAAGRLKYGSRTVQRTVSAAKGHNNASFTRTNLSGEFDHWTQSSVASAGKLLFDLDHEMMHGNVLDSVTISIVGATSGTFVGITMPTISVWRITDAGVETQLGSTGTDASATDGAYTALHSIYVTGIAHTIDTVTNQYFIKFTGATGGTSASGLVIRKLLVGVTFTVQPEF